LPIASFEQIPQVRAPGLLINSGSGQPGTAASGYVDSTGSINGDNDPLYISSGGMAFSTLPTQMQTLDFASVCVLKDAQTEVLFMDLEVGNGVIVITSKRWSVGAAVQALRWFLRSCEPNFDISRYQP
jgi:hypothetical protein